MTWATKYHVGMSNAHCALQVLLQSFGCPHVDQEGFLLVGVGVKY